ncbi:MAG: hypothetical protein M3067_04950 [Chloroflexota bacterium]|nr:hypothetical protein [Chloroflexota bacterium]
MELVVVPQLAFLAVAGIVGGLVLLVRGFGAYRTAGLIEGTSTSTVTSLAVGEVRVTGVVEPAELSLISPLQSVPCVYYRWSIHESSGRDSRTVLEEERAVGFRVRDATGTVRVFPSGAGFDVPAQYSESTSMFGEAPTGLLLRTGPSIGPGEPDREVQVAALLTVNPALGPGDDRGAGAVAWRFGGLGAVRPGTGQLQYREARIELGQVVTIVGQTLPFDQLPDPAGADVGGSGGAFGAGGDPEIAADLAAARAAGRLAPDAATAWGNAAIPGFGVGHPVVAPVLDPAAHALPLATAEQADRAKHTFVIGPEELVLAASAGAPLTVALGPPAEAAGRQESRFLVGLLGAVLAIAAAVALALMLPGGFG